MLGGQWGLPFPAPGAAIRRSRETTAPGIEPVVDLIRTADVSNKTNSDLALELAERWLRPIRAVDWPERLSLLNDIHDYLREEIPDFAQFCDVFPHFIAELIERLGDPVVHSSDQAHIFANSADARHRQAAAAWFAEERRRERL